MNEQDLGNRLQAAQRFAREAGELGLRLFRDSASLQVSNKGVQNVVSNGDKELEALLRGRIATEFPEDAFFGEESGRGGNADLSRGIWVVDPVDGTDNFIRGMPGWTISIAFVVGREVEIGVLYEPVFGEMYVARRGFGATLNGVRLAPPRITSLRDGLVGLGYSLRRPHHMTVQALDRLLAGQGMFQRGGSGALMIAYVACGRYIGFYEAHMNSWDCMAGVALVRESGGWTNDFLAGEGLLQGNVMVAAAPGLEDAMRGIAGLTASSS
jgi:myo-inositol-1(or 4)-monophosphatase